MKKLILAIVCTVFILSANAVKPNNPGFRKIDSKQLFYPIGEKGNKISLYELSKISKKDLEEKSGKKMNQMQKLSLKVMQKKLNKMMDTDGNIKVKNNKKAAYEIDGETGFHLGGFALGFFVGIIGVLIAYLIDDDKKRNRTKWAWIGFGIGVVISVILLVALANAITP